VRVEAGNRGVGYVRRGRLGHLLYRLGGCTAREHEVLHKDIERQGGFVLVDLDDMVRICDDVEALPGKSDLEWISVWVVDAVKDQPKLLGPVCVQ
jgi:hypothetical protein